MTQVKSGCSTLSVLLLAASAPGGWAQLPPPQGPPGRAPNAQSLKAVPVPQFINADKYIQDQNALVALGKAFFWDMQAGSDGRVACASCHFHAGADHRSQNQLSNSLASFAPNHSLASNEFPFHILSNPADNRSAVASDSAQIAGSQGIFRRTFTDVVPGSATDSGTDNMDRPAFSVGGVNVRQVGTRNAPSVINAIFNLRNFWDGRASNTFTGLTPFGASDSRANALAFSSGALAAELVSVGNGSLASQAVGPPMNDLEASYAGRTWPKLGKKMLSLKPLAKQRVAADDSVLGALANPSGSGLLPQHTYLSLIQSAFKQAYWSSDQLVDASGTALGGRRGPAANTNEFTQTEFNFAVFWGLAIQAYEATLVSDNTRLDQFAEGNTQALTAQEQTGLNVFRRSGCQTCHSGAEFTAASVGSVARQGATQRGRNNTGPDTGFFRTGVRPASEDIGLAALDDFGNAISAAVKQSANALQGVTGLFMTPTLRNVEFTGPYFHNGGQATLDQVVDFYNRGGDFPNGGVGPDIRRLNLSPDDHAALTAFLRALSDDRVRFEQAPFDHPELCVSTGADTTRTNSDPRFPTSAADKWAGIPSVGRTGNPVPLQTFDELLQGIGADGSRAHSLNDACGIP